MTDTVQIQEPYFDAILRQPVAVIDKRRTMVATTVCSAIGTAHWEIGKLLYDRKVESKHGSGVVNRLSYDLKQRYPQMGVFPRNLWNMKKNMSVFAAASQNAVKMATLKRNLVIAKRLSLFFANFAL